MELNKIYNMDCIEGMKELPNNSIDSIVTDPPYGLGFMSKEWDSLPPSREVFEQCLRVLKPGGYLLCFGGTRTYHRMAVAIEDTGFEIRDMINWCYGSGFPKSLNIGKAVDKLQGNERISTGEIKNHSQKGVAIAEERSAIGGGAFGQAKDEEITIGTSEWEGWGTALKPAHEPICMARKPLAEKTVVENVLKWGTGGINIDESRVELNGENRTTPIHSDDIKDDNTMFGLHSTIQHKRCETTQGRFPANLIHDNSEEVRECFPETKSGFMKKGHPYGQGDGQNVYGKLTGKTQSDTHGDSGNASRYFKSIIYQGKASKKERGQGNSHPTVKPIALMEYLIKMVTPKGGVVLDPFAGSGTTLVAAKQNGFNYIGIEMTEEYIPIIEARLKSANKK